MSDYRIYIMDRSGVHIDDCASVRALCDADAIGAANRRRDRRPSELWLGGRMICKMPALRDSPLMSAVC